jgi:hypothetical protein
VVTPFLKTALKKFFQKRLILFFISDKEIVLDILFFYFFIYSVFPIILKGLGPFQLFIKSSNKLSGISNSLQRDIVFNFLVMFDLMLQIFYHHSTDEVMFLKI